MTADMLAAQRSAPATLAQLISGVPDDTLHRRPAPGKWSIVEIIAHLAEDELTSSWRYRQMLEHDGVALLGFDQELWARLGDYNSWTARDALDMFRLLRQANVTVLSHLSPAEWERSGTHAERGRLTVRSLAAHMVGHDANHIAQIQRILAGGV
ncbi:MAG TPA: DinB family protein [Gemmatimonadaceae bacterium]|nr:DinB family protein [Gemmatimonadaceae bacterium]